MPATIPSLPSRTYKHDGWQGIGHWLGTGNVAPKAQQFLPFKKAVLYAGSLKLKTKKEWDAWPATIPLLPSRSYTHDGWQGWGH